MWGWAAEALSPIVQVPANAILACDVRDVAFMKDDETDAAKIRQLDATTINTLYMAGYDPDAIIEAVTADDFTRLAGTHSGALPVQVHPGSANGDSANGSNNGSPMALAQSGTQ